MIGSHNNQTALNTLKFSGCLLFVFFLLAAFPSLAQEKQDYPNAESDRSIDEMNQHPDGHLNTNKDREILRDSVVLKPVSIPRAKGEAPHKNKPDEEPLSFNFLYFIIQKFKVSDMIDN